MDCPGIREALSARLDDEDAGIDAATVDQHLHRCPACTAWAVEADALHRAVRVRAADDVPDLTAAILASVQPIAVRASACSSSSALP